VAKKVIHTIKLQIPAGQATPAPPVGTALGPTQINIMEFCKAFNDKTQKESGMIIPAVITIYADRSFSFITKTPPAPVLIKKALKLDKASGEPNRLKVGRINEKDVEEIARIKMEDLNAIDLEGAKSMVRGTARSMGILVGAEVGEIASAEEIAASQAAAVAAASEEVPAVPTPEGEEEAPAGEGAGPEGDSAPVEGGA
jgi:large subunit ribosomal protein L11